jgi:hypothetical protein
MEIRKNGRDELILGQSNYLDECLKRFGGDVIIPKRVPLAKGTYVEPCPHSDEGCTTTDEKALFMSFVGCLNYLSTHTRPDIAYAVHQLAQHMHNPCKSHLLLCQDVLCYLAGTRGCALSYGGESGGVMKLIGYSDANFPPTRDAKASIGWVWFLTCGRKYNLISWSSHKLRHVCTSTEEAELAAASEAIKEGIALRGILIETGFLSKSDRALLHIDNKAAVCVCQDGGYYPRLKHVNREHKFIIYAVKECGVNVLWCKGTDMLADGLTKALGGPQLDAFRKIIFRDDQ